MKCFTYGQGILDQNSFDLIPDIKFLWYLDQISLFHALLSPGVVIQEDMQWFFLMWHQKIMEPLLIWDNY